MENKPAIGKMLDLAWNRESAESSLERWQSIAQKEDWDFQQQLPLLIKVFGASWYFTRFIFFRGREILPCFENLHMSDFSTTAIANYLQQVNYTDDAESNMDLLRCAKNELMLRIFLARVEGYLTQQQQELSLTNLAEQVLQTTLKLVTDDNPGIRDNIAILAMGRMAGQEMNFGSDLDLIFLYSKQESDNQSRLIKSIQRLQRHIAAPSATGLLYEIDMRLRPHGTSGTLISPVEYFLEFHSGDRETWERQMMTRCRSIFDPRGLVNDALKQVGVFVYGNYDQQKLRQDVLEMRARVQHELGSPAGKYEIKRGPGGIMDIDFITHYLQLLHGNEHVGLQTASTREALVQLCQSGMLDESARDELLQAYDFLKAVEGVLRIMDMKNISAFSRDPHELTVLSRALGYAGKNNLQQAKNFLAQYKLSTATVRQHFTDLVGPVETY